MRDFVAAYTPGHVQAVRRCEIVTTAGETSPQCDVGILDISTPPLLDTDNYRIVPSECVYGVIEVKTRLDKAQLIDACERVRQVKSLPKTAYFPDPLARSITLNGRDYPYMPTFGMIFAFDGIDMLTLAEHFTTWAAEHEPEEFPNSVWVLGKGWLQWMEQGTEHWQLWPAADPGLSMMKSAWPDEDILLPLTLHLNSHLAEAWMPPLRLARYAYDHVIGVPTHTFTPRGPASPPEGNTRK